MKVREKYLVNSGFKAINLPITEREKEVLIHLAQGKKNKEISEELVVSPFTIRNHISSIFTKLRISNRSQATAVAIYSGLLNYEPEIDA